MYGIKRRNNLILCHYPKFGGLFWSDMDTILRCKHDPVVRYNGYEIDYIVQQVMTKTNEYIYTMVFEFTEEELEQITMNKLSN